MASHRVLWGFLGVLVATGLASGADDLPFQHQVEVYRSDKENLTAFTVRLEQPFLAEEFEKSNYLRLHPTDENAYLVYPKETRFRQKHAEFYGRLRGEGKVKLTLSYETVSENLDGSRRVQTRQGTIEVTIPPAPPAGESVGARSIFQKWAEEQNSYFAHLLQYYPDETFLQYCLLQSNARYGVKPPRIPKGVPNKTSLETGMYQLFSGSLAMQESLQRQSLSTQGDVGDLNTHISALQPPALKSLDYEKLLKERSEQKQIEPQVHEISKLVPAEQYFLYFHSMKSLGDALDLTKQWGNSLLRLYTVQAQDNRLVEKVSEQLCLRRDPLTQMFADGVVTEVALTGADPFVLEGTDLSLIFNVEQREVFAKETSGWVDEAKRQYPELVSQSFNYRGHQVTAHYTNDRVISAFIVWHEEYAVYSNSHRAIRRILDAAVDSSTSLHEALDYRYVTTILPPSPAEDTGYFFASEACIKQLISPAAKISQKRRLQCFNNLVMINNASLFYRLEYGRSPESLSELIEGRFVDPAKIVCPHGGAYAFDVAGDTCTCSLHNRLRYLTPNVELSVLQVSQQEAQEYERYKQRYREFWQEFFDPIAVRMTINSDVKLEACVLPLANGSIYRNLQRVMDKHPQPIDTARLAPSAVASLVLVPGRENAAQYLRLIPGISEVVKEDPTLTDLSWLGDRVSLNYCDGETILQIDPTRLGALDVPFIGQAPLPLQGAVAALLMSTNLPVYVTIDFEDRQKAERLVTQFAERIFLKQGNLGPLPTTLDAYRLPDYKEHPMYVLDGQVYALTLRLHIALVGDQFVLATRPEVLREVIDASRNEPNPDAVKAHLLVRFNRRGLDRLRDNVEMYWAEKARRACHRNIMSIYNLHKLYHAPVGDIPELSQAKYGVRYFCPDNGEYSFDSERNQVVCSVHGNREHSRQPPGLNERSSFAEFINSLEEVTAALRYEDEALIATVNIQRQE